MSYSKREAVVQLLNGTVGKLDDNRGLLSACIELVDEIWERVPESEPKPKRKTDPLVLLLKNKLGCGVQQARQQIKALREASWTDDRISEAIHKHASPGLSPWDWTKKVMSQVITRKEPGYDPFQ